MAEDLKLHSTREGTIYAEMGVEENSSPLGALILKRIGCVY